MIQNSDIAEGIWSDLPDDVDTRLSDVFLGPEPDLGFLLGFLPFRRDEDADNPIPYQVWRTPVTFIQPDGTMRFQRFAFVLWWNGRPYLDVGSVEEQVAQEVPLVMNHDALEHFQDNPVTRDFHLVPLSHSRTATEITTDNFGDDVDVAMVQRMRFNNIAERDDFIDFAAEVL